MDNSVMGVIRTLTPDEAAERLKKLGVSTSAQKIRAGLEQGVYPFGVRIQMKGNVYEIYERLFNKWVEERIDKGDESSENNN